MFQTEREEERRREILSQRICQITATDDYGDVDCICSLVAEFYLVLPSLLMAFMTMFNYMNLAFCQKLCLAAVVLA